MKQLAWIFVILLTVTTLLFAADALTIGPNGVITVRVHGRDQTLDSALAPVGTINAYGGTTDPAGNDLTAGGWLICDGRALSSADYPQLFAVIGTSFGNGSTDGDGNPASGDFNLPDMRGRFARGLDTTDIGQEPRDPDRATRAVGSVQQDAFQGHWHYGPDSPDASPGARSAAPSASGNFGVHALTSVPNLVMFEGTKYVHDSNGNGDPRVSSETRPQNVAVNYIIKY